MKMMHIIAGLLALAAGAIALYATKGSWLHRRSGTIFAYAMLLMSGSGALMAAAMASNRVSVIAGVLTFYLVGTGLLTVLRPVEQSRAWVTAFLLLASAATVYAVALALQGLASPSGRVDGLPPAPMLLFATLGLLGVVGDARLLRAGRMDGPRRLGRHLWRMGVALWIATASFFLGQADLFPEPARRSGWLAIPVVLVLVTVVAWMVRVRRLGRRATGTASPTAANATE